VLYTENVTNIRASVLVHPIYFSIADSEEWTRACRPTTRWTKY